MFRSHRMASPFSPALLAGFAMRPLPLALLQPLLNAAMAALGRRHPGLFDRLEGLDDPRFLIDPVDLPFFFVLRPDSAGPSLRAVKTPPDESEVTAYIRGPLLTLIDLLEGRIDGDAMFFSRDLEIEGDTEAVVALRNAVDGAEIDVLGDLLSPLGLLAGPARRAAGLAGAVFSRAAKDLEELRTAFIAPAMRHGEAQDAASKDREGKAKAESDPRRRAKTGIP